MPLQPPGALAGKHLSLNSKLKLAVRPNSHHLRIYSKYSLHMTNMKSLKVFQNNFTLVPKFHSP